VNSQGPSQPVPQMPYVQMISNPSQSSGKLSPKAQAQANSGTGEFRSSTKT